MVTKYCNQSYTDELKTVNPPYLDNAGLIHEYLYRTDPDTRMPMPADCTTNYR